MTKTQYLYGLDVKPSDWEGMGYKEVLTLKAKLAWLRIQTLNEVHYMSKDSLNINECVAAIKFNEALIKELYNGRHL